jgi:hypothetical protein
MAERSGPVQPGEATQKPKAAKANLRVIFASETLSLTVSFAPLCGDHHLRIP